MYIIKVLYPSHVKATDDCKNDAFKQQAAPEQGSTCLSRGDVRAMHDTPCMWLCAWGEIEPILFRVARRFVAANQNTDKG